jgi:hypothetical protein
MATAFALTLTGIVRAQETKLTVMVFQGSRTCRFSPRSRMAFSPSAG